MNADKLRDSLNLALAGRYVLDRKIGGGGMSLVYHARDLKHTRDVAIKVLNPDIGALLAPERFLREIRVTAALQHPHLLPLFDSGEAGGLLFYVMPYVEGISLSQRLRRHGALGIEETVRLATQVASALECAHRHDVVHRDIKPDNILIRDGEAVVVDFGIALAIRNAGDARLTKTGIFVGTPEYMSPEQASGAKVIDARTDIYSLGCVVYEMLAGQVPFAGASTQVTITRLLREPPPPLTATRLTVPPHVDAAVLKALQKEPGKRFQTVREFADALNGVVRGAAAKSATKASESALARRWQAVAVASAVVALTALWFAMQ